MIPQAQALTPITLTVWLAVGGLLGGTLHALFMGTTPSFWCRETGKTIFLGGIMGLLYPLYPIIPFHPEANVIQQAGLVTLIAFIVGAGIQSILPGIFQKLTGQPRP